MTESMEEKAESTELRVESSEERVESTESTESAEGRAPVASAMPDGRLSASEPIEDMIPLKEVERDYVRRDEATRVAYSEYLRGRREQVEARWREEEGVPPELASIFRTRKSVWD